MIESALLLQPEGEMAAQMSMPEAQTLWFVQAAGRVWGPYTDARLAAFVGERRLTAASLVAAHPSGPFGPAGRRRELRALFDPSPEPEPEAPPPIQPTIAPPPLARPTAPQPVAPRANTTAQPRTLPPDPQPRPVRPQAAGAARSLLVWAELYSQAPAAFEAALSVHGPVIGVHDGVWLVRAALDAAALRNDLTRGLGPRDALLVVEAPLEQAAWFNLGQSPEREMRRLWSQG